MIFVDQLQRHSLDLDIPDVHVDDAGFVDGTPVEPAQQLLRVAPEIPKPGRSVSSRQRCPDAIGARAKRSIGSSSTHGSGMPSRARRRWQGRGMKTTQKGKRKKHKGEP